MSVGVTFDDIIRSRLGDAVSTPSKSYAPDYVPYADGELDPTPIHEINEDPIDVDSTAVFEKPITDHLINADLQKGRICNQLR